MKPIASSINIPSPLIQSDKPVISRDSSFLPVDELRRNRENPDEDNAGIYKSVKLMHNISDSTGGNSISANDALNIIFDKAEGKKIWEFKTDCNAPTPSLGIEGTVYYRKSKEICAVKDGKKLWELELDYVDRMCAGPDGVVYAGCQDSKIYAIKDGKKLWELKLEDRIHTTPNVDTDGTVYVGRYNTLYAIKDGQKLWEFDAGSNVGSSCIGSDGTVYFGNWDGTLYAVKDGKEIWKSHVGRYCSNSPSIGPDGTVFITSYEKLTAVKDGKNLWEFETDNNDTVTPESPCISPDGVVYVDCAKKLYAIKDGKKMWEFNPKSNIRTAPCPGPEETVLIGCADGTLYAVKDGNVYWKFKTGGSQILSPGIDKDGTIYLGSTDGKIYSLTSPGYMKGESDEDCQEEKQKIEISVNGDGIDEWLIVGGLKLPIKQ